MTLAAELDERRKRALYRAGHRGTKEMDWLLGRYAEAELANMTNAELEVFETLLALPDPDLESWLTKKEASSAPEGKVTEMIARVRAFHGVDE